MPDILAPRCRVANGGGDQHLVTLSRFLAEPLGTRRQDDIIITDLRVEKEIALGSRRNISAFLDVYNLFNSNPAQNLGWVSGASFNRPLSVVPPRLGRIGLKLNF